MLSNAAKIFGIFFLILGIASVIPAASHDNLLFGVLQINSANLSVFFATGILGFVAGMLTNRASKVFFLVCGVGFGLFALFGFMNPDGAEMGGMSHSLRNAWFYMTVAAVSVFLGALPESGRIRSDHTAAA